MALDLSSLRNAVNALDRSINVVHSGKGSMSEDLLEAVRAGVIQKFEVAYEQCWKFVQRWLRENQSPEDAEHPRTRKDLFRAAARFGLIADPLPWFSYGDARNLTSHTYNEEQAAIVYESAEKFVADAKALLLKLETLND
jgi:nucleotidyltransferase substrate binding protein (TIGR01987 family)